MLRLEGFSGCCGVYARVDLPAAAFDREIQGRGTTNVDFNTAHANSLGSGCGIARTPSLERGPRGVELTHAGRNGRRKESEAADALDQGLQRGAGLSAGPDVAAGGSRRGGSPIRSQPARGRGAEELSYVVASGNSLRLSQVAQPGAVPVQGMNRIRAIDPLFSSAQSLRIWSEMSGVSGWEVVFATARFFLLISPELQRGFSGEGQVLAQLASGKWQEALPYVQAKLAGQIADRCCGAGASKLGLPVEEVQAALRGASARAARGFRRQPAESSFHRELPFQLEQVEALQPRLKEARKLLAEKALQDPGDAGRRLVGRERAAGPMSCITSACGPTAIAAPASGSASIRANAVPANTSSRRGCWSRTIRMRSGRRQANHGGVSCVLEFESSRTSHWTMD